MTYQIVSNGRIHDKVKFSLRKKGRSFLYFEEIASGKAIAEKIMWRENCEFHLLWNDGFCSSENKSISPAATHCMLLIGDKGQRRVHKMAGTNGLQPFVECHHFLNDLYIFQFIGWQLFSTENVLHLGANLGRISMVDDTQGHAAAGIISLFRDFCDGEIKESLPTLEGRWSRYDSRMNIKDGVMSFPNGKMYNIWIDDENKYALTCKHDGSTQFRGIYKVEDDELTLKYRSTSSVYAAKPLVDFSPDPEYNLEVWKRSPE